MNRRDFLGVLAVPVAVGLAAAPLVQSEPMRDDFMYRGYRMRWADWREPSNQAVAFGFWMAIDGDGRFHYATTMGGFVTHHAGEMDVINLTWNRKEWPSPAAMMRASVNERDAVKRRALSALLEAL